MNLTNKKLILLIDGKSICILPYKSCPMKHNIMRYDVMLTVAFYDRQLDDRRKTREDNRSSFLDLSACNIALCNHFDTPQKYCPKIL